MRIGLDTRNTGRAGGTGVATYARVLAEACHRAGLGTAWVDDDMAGVEQPRSPARRTCRAARSLLPSRRLRPTGPSFTGRDLYRTAEIRDRWARVPTLLRASGAPDVMHWTCPLPLRWPGVPNVVTIHDLIPLLHPDLSDTPKARLARRLAQCCRDAAAVVTISEAVRRDIVAVLGIPARRIAMLSQAVWFPEEDLAASHTVASPVPSGGFLYFGSLERRKNIGRLITAHGRSGTRRPLILIGTPGFGAEGELAALAAHPAPERVHQVSWCSRAMLIRAMREARAVVFPSLAEGFGLPIAEAMTLGTPVVTSAGHATEEIAGGAALLVEARDGDALADALRCLDVD
ncbi:glycosyltransferase family 4 protein, partial [Ameyamaea chiangmaiensis]